MMRFLAILKLHIKILQICYFKAEPELFYT
jgi:hypothetical protein